MAVNGLKAGGGTAMATGMRESLNLFRQLPSDHGRKRVIVLLADGETPDKNECQNLSNEAKQMGVTLFTFGLSLGGENTEEMKLMKELGDNGKNYEFLQDPSRIGLTFQQRILEAARTGIENAKLTIRPVKAGEGQRWSKAEVVEGALVLPNYLPSANPVEIQIGSIQVEKETTCLIKFDAVLPTGISSSEPVSFARFSLVGDVPSLGIVQEELSSANILLRFSDNAADHELTDPDTEKWINIARAAKAIKAAGEATKKEDAQKLIRESQKALDKAAQKKVIKKNTAARKKSRMMKKFNALSK
jgi:ribosomal protein S20